MKLYNVIICPYPDLNNYWNWAMFELSHPIQIYWWDYFSISTPQICDVSNMALGGYWLTVGHGRRQGFPVTPLDRNQSIVKPQRFVERTIITAMRESCRPHWVTRNEGTYILTLTGIHGSLLVFYHKSSIHCNHSIKHLCWLNAP